MKVFCWRKRAWDLNPDWEEISIRWNLFEELFMAGDLNVPKDAHYTVELNFEEMQTFQNMMECAKGNHVPEPILKEFSLFNNQPLMPALRMCKRCKCIYYRG